MAWFIVHRTSNGEIVSEADDMANVASPLPAGLAVKDVGTQPNWQTQNWNPATKTIQAKPADVVLINPLITKAQAITTLKNLLETNPNVWTQLQRDQCSYLQLLGRFIDLKNGTVY